MSAHTPGPWTWVKNKHGDYWALEDHRGIAIVDDGSACDEYDKTIDPEGSEEDRANARLIAASPKMFAALKKVVAWLNSPEEGAFSDGDLAECEQAIAEAEGKQ